MRCKIIFQLTSTSESSGRDLDVHRVQRVRRFDSVQHVHDLQGSFSVDTIVHILRQVRELHLHRADLGQDGSTTSPSRQRSGTSAQVDTRFRQAAWCIESGHELLSTLFGFAQEKFVASEIVHGQQTTDHTNVSLEN